LPQPQRLRVEARMHEITGQWSKAVDIHRALQILSPDDIEVTIGLINVLSGAGRAAEALEVLAEARRLSPHWQGDVRLDLAESFANRELANYTRMQAVAARAVANGRARGQRHLVAQARRLEGQAYHWLGRLAEARSAHAEARRFYQEVGDRRGVAIAWNDEGLIDLSQGRLDEAERKWSEALSIGRALGDRDGVALAKNNLSLVLERRGDDAGVRAYLEEALATWEETGRDARVLLAVGNLALLHMRTGNLSEARRLGERALAAARQRGLPKEEFFALRLLMDVEIASGHLAQARDLASQVDRSMGDSPADDDRANALDGRARLDEIAGAPDQAARRMAEAVALLVGSGADLEKQAYARLRQAQHLQVAGQPSRAERPLLEAIPILAAQKHTLLESLARATLALCRLDQGDVPTASAEIARAIRLLEGVETRYLERLEVALARAKVTAAAGQRDEARRQLTSIVTEADQIGVIPLRLEATLALGTIERRAGRARLRALAEEAEKRGFVRIAQAAARRAR
jgi:tetratricopeptide (TPR) repeat protein